MTSPTDRGPFVVIGGGGHGRVAIELVRAGGGRLLGVLDPGRQAGDDVLGVPVLGGDEVIPTLDAGEVRLVNGIGSIADTTKRRQVYLRWSKDGYWFPALVHPTVILSGAVQVRDGAQLMAGAVIQTGTVVGENAVVNTSATVDHDCLIGAHAHIAPGATLAGEVEVGPGAHIGSGATVIQGIRVGEEAIVGAGAVVIADIPPGVTAVGVPARW